MLALGCGLFDPREPRPSTPIVLVPCRVLTSPDSVIANLVGHYGRTQGLTCYGSLVDPGFLFFPDTQDSLERTNPPAPSPFENWNRNVEMDVTQTIASGVDSVQVFFDGEYAPRSTTTSPASETRYYNYHLLVYDPDTTRYQGQAEVTMVQGASTLWTLRTWRDRRDASGFPTWGSFRADNRSGV